MLRRSGCMVFACVIGLCSSPSFGFRSGPPAGRNGSTASFNNSCRVCHGNAMGGGAVELSGVPSLYTPNTIYNISVRVVDSTKLGAGFQLSVEDGAGAHQGNFILTEPTFTQHNGRWVNHTGQGVNNAVANWAVNGESATYNVQWQAPASDVGTVRFWAAGNAINNNGSSSGDIVYLLNILVGAVLPTGACCDDLTGICVDGQTQADCEGGGDRYGGANSTCANIDPSCISAAMGACCDDRGVCSEDVLQAECEAEGSRFGGDGSTCATLDPPCETPLAISLETFVSGLSSPVDLTHAGDGSGRIFIVDQVGQIRVVDAGGNLLARPFLDISSLIPPPNAFFDERGLLGLAFHPNYETNGRFFIRYSKPRAGAPEEPCNDPNGFIVGCHEEILAEYRVSVIDPNQADPASEIILFRADKPQFNHDSGQVAFGPDGYLYWTLGDGGGGNDGLADVPPSHGPIGNGQNRFAKLGKIHRIDVDNLGWVQNPANGHWYRLTVSYGTWMNANDQAIAAGGYLTTICSQEENDWVTQLATIAAGATERSGEGNNAWIGYRDAGSGWGWENGEICSYTNLHSNWNSFSLNHAYILGADHGEPGFWGRNQLHDNDFIRNVRGVIERDTPPPYGIPTDNPFADGIDGLPEIYAYGLRNPYKFSFDDGPGGDGTLWLSDVGQGLYEELNIGASGANYGWVIREGAHCFDPFNPVTPPASCPTTGALGEPLVDPVMEYLHRVTCTTDADCAPLGVGCNEALGECENEGGISIIGGFVYRGSAVPSLSGIYVFGDFSDAFFSLGGRLYYMETTGPDAYKRRQFFLSPNNAPLGQFVKGFGEDENGELYTLVSTQLGPLGTGGSVLRIAPPFPSAPGADPTGINKCRFISFNAPAPTLVEGSVETALRIKLTSLHHVAPPYSGGSTIAFTAFEGLSVWIGPPATYVESSATQTPFRAAIFSCVPIYRDWSTEGLLHVTGSAIVPSSIYHVESVAAACTGVEGTAPECQSGGQNVSSQLEIRTTRWGDVEIPYSPPSTAEQPDFGDIAALVNKFRSLPNAPIKARALLSGYDAFGAFNTGILEFDLSFSHIARCVDAFRGIPYPYKMGRCATFTGSGGACATDADCTGSSAPPCLLYCY